MKYLTIPTIPITMMSEIKVGCRGSNPDFIRAASTQSWEFSSALMAKVTKGKEIPKIIVFNIRNLSPLIFFSQIWAYSRGFASLVIKPENLNSQTNALQFLKEQS